MADAHTSGDVGAIEVVVDDWCDARDGGVARGHLLNGLNLVLLGDCWTASSPMVAAAVILRM